MEEEILNKADIKTIHLVKEESEKLFNSVSEVDNVLTSKSSNLLNICISILIITLGFSISELLYENYSKFLIYSIFISILLFFVVLKLIRNINPISTILLGSDKLINSDFIKGSEHDEYLILTNRLLNIQDGIDTNRKITRNKAKQYKESYNVLIIGFISISFLFFLFCLFLN
jgi:hypothetical protein